MIQIGGVYTTFCQEKGILLRKYRDRNWRCIAILFKSIGVRGRSDSPDQSWLDIFQSQLRNSVSIEIVSPSVLLSGHSWCTEMGSIEKFNPRSPRSIFSDAAFLLTAGSFLHTVELTVVFGSFFAYNWSFFIPTIGVFSLTDRAFLLTVGKCF